MLNEKMKMPEEEFGVSHQSQRASSKLGIVLFLLIIALIMLLVGLYFWGTALRDATEIPTIPNITRPTAEENNEPESTKAEAEVSNLEALSTSDTLGAIKADLESTNMADLDAGLTTIENELDVE